MLRFCISIFIVGIFLGLNNTLSQETGFKTCTPQGPSCVPNQCRTNPSMAYSIDSNNGTIRTGSTERFINGYQFNLGYSSDPSDKVKSNRFMGRYGLNNSTAPSVRQIQKKINKLAEVHGGTCQATCEDGRFGNDTIAKMSDCLCVDAEEGPINFSGDCPEGYEPDDKNCCKKKPTCESQSKISPPCEPGYTTGADGCCELVPIQCTNNSPMTGSDCSTYGSGWIEDASNTGCCIAPAPVPIQCTNNNPMTGSDCSTYGSGWIEDNANLGCCIPPPNPCTSTGEYGTPTSTGRDCKSCGSGTKPNSDHTKCICDPAQGCCGIKLNTIVPFIGDCIEMSNDSSSANTTRVTPLNAFPKLMGSLSKIIVTAILIFSFVMLVAGGVLITSGGIKQENYKSGIDLIQKVVIALALLGASGIILRLINPNFFG